MQSCGVASVRVTAQKGKVSWHLGAKDYHQVTPHKKPHMRDLLGKIQEGGYLCSVEKQQRTEQEAGFIEGFLWGWAKLSRVAWDW